MSDLYERAVMLVEFIHSDIGQSGLDIQVEAIKCELESITKESKQQRDQLLAALKAARAWMDDRRGIAEIVQEIIDADAAIGAAMPDKTHLHIG
mgnify:CR=1 FL=1